MSDTMKQQSEAQSSPVASQEELLKQLSKPEVLSDFNIQKKLSKEKKLVTLKEYVSRMKDDQTNITSTDEESLFKIIDLFDVSEHDKKILKTTISVLSENSQHFAVKRKAKLPHLKLKGLKSATVTAVQKRRRNVKKNCKPQGR